MEQRVFGPGVKLYHYTSTEGFHGILSTRQIWATDSRYLNDTEELVHGYRLAECVLRELWRDTAGSEKQERLEALTGEICKIRDRTHTLTVFVTCFSLADDLLSQWRAYCPVGGVALGFDRWQLMHSIEGQPFELGPCVYDEGQQVQLLRRELTEFVLSCLGVSDAFWNAGDYKTSFLNGLHVTLGRVVPLLKHAAFQEEREWRLFASVETVNFGGGLNYQYRTRRGLVVPYAPIALDPIAWHGSEIVVGPGQNMELVAHSAVRMTEAQFSIWPRVRKSHIPYRGV